MATLFSIQCDTCLSKLKVTSQSAIGQILACPKCGSMVQVQPPPGWLPVDGTDQVAAPAAASPAGSATGLPSDSSAFEDIGQLLDQADKPKEKAASEKSLKPASPRNNQTFPAIPPPRSMQGDASAPPDEPLLPSEQWTSEAAKARQKMLWLYGGSAVGLLVAVVMIFFLIVQFTGQGNRTDLAQADQSTINSPEDGDQAVNADDQLEKSQQDDQLQLPEDDGKSDVAQVEPADNNEKTKVDPPTPVDDDIDKQIADVAPTKTEDKKTDEDLPEFLKGHGKPAEAGNVGVGESAIADLTKLSEILDTSAFAAAIEGEMPNPDLAGDFAKEIDFIKKPLPSKAVNFERSMSSEIEGIQFKAHFLADALRIVETLTDVPVTLQADALELANVRTTDEISLTLVKTNPLNILRAIFEPHGLVVSEGKHGIVVGSTDAGLLERRSYDIAALAADASAIDRLVELLRNFVSPASWTNTEGMGVIDVVDGKLEILQTADNQRQIADLLKKIRRARGLDSGADPAEKVRPRHQLALEALKTPTKVEFIQPDKLADLVAKIAKQHGLSILIDWESLYESGWNLQTDVPFGAAEETLQESFENLLVAMKLSMVGYGDNLFVITSPAKAALTTTIEVYPLETIVKDDITAKKLAGQVQRIVEAELAANPTAGFFVNTVDGYYLIAKLSQNKQIVLDNYLAGVRSSLAKTSE